MSLTLGTLRAEDKRKNLTREQLLALRPDLEYNDGRTKQCFKDECDINKIMARFAQTGTISHLEKNEGVYADFSDFDFVKQMQMLTRGREIFDDLPAELRREFDQSPAAFFDFVNDPANKDDLLEKLPALARPGDQLSTPKRNAAEPTELVETPATPEPEPDPAP